LSSLQPIFTTLCSELDLIVASANDTTPATYLSTLQPYCIADAECNTALQQTAHEDQSFTRFQNMAMPYVENSVSIYRIYRNLLCIDPATDIQLAHVKDSIGIVNVRMLAMRARITPVCPSLQHYVVREDGIGRCVCHQDAVCNDLYRRDTSILIINITIAVLIGTAMFYTCYMHRKIHIAIPHLRPVQHTFNRWSTGGWF